VIETCSKRGVDEKCMQNFVRKTRREVLLGRPRCRWKYNIKIGHQEICCEETDRIHLTQDRVRGGLLWTR
jgi:hypothetical protein